MDPGVSSGQRIGQVNGQFDLTGKGDSVGSLLASSNGKLGLVVAGGEVSKLMMEKIGLHLWEILSLNLTGDRLVKLRCAVADFDVKQGGADGNGVTAVTERDRDPLDGGNWLHSTEFRSSKPHFDAVALETHCLRRPVRVPGSLALASPCPPVPAAS